MVTRLISALNVRHPEFDHRCADFTLTQMQRLRAYFRGGDDFPKSHELQWKALELSSQECAQPMRRARLSCSFYKNYFAETIKDLVSSLCVNPLKIEDEKDRPYWTDLYDNADGSRGCATAEIRAAVTDDFIYDRAFYLVLFPESKATRKGLGAQFDAGDLDARIIHLDTTKIINWRTLKDGTLEFATCYEMELVGNDYLTEKHTWIIYSKADVTVYEATKPVTVPVQPWKEDDRATLNEDESGTHQSEQCPVFKVNRKTREAVGENLLQPCRQLFNEVSDARYYRFTKITGGANIFTEDRDQFKNGLTFSPQGANIFGSTDKYEDVRVDSGMFAALDAACAAGRGEIGGLIFGMARQSATQSASGQNTSRNTGVALTAHSDPMNAWLRSFAETHLACWRLMLDAVAAIREEDISSPGSKVAVTGLISEDEGGEGFTLDDAQTAEAFMALPRVSELAKDEYAKAIGYEACVSAGVDDETLEKVANAEAAKLVEPPKPEIVPGPVPENLPLKNPLKEAV